MTTNNDPLVQHLAELCVELDKNDVSVILGGGMGLYLRRKLFSARVPRYPFDPVVRSTADLDLFLSSKLIVDPKKVTSLKESLLRLKYDVNPDAKNFQFIKTVTLPEGDREIKIDLLSAPPEAADLKKVKISEPRIRPKGVDGIHAYLTEEAEGIEIGKQPVDLATLDAGAKPKNQILYLPSAYNFLILKLNAFDDRKDDEDKDNGRHHAFDIFSTVVRMNEADWDIARKHLAAQKGRPYLEKTIAIRKDNFELSSARGSIRLRENVSYRTDKSTYDAYLDNFLSDLSELFPA